MSTALTPRVRTLVVCDGIRASRIEGNVYNLKGARGRLYAETFPLRRPLGLYLVLSSPRPGRFPAHVQVVEDQTDRTVFIAAIDPAPSFADADDFVPLEMVMNISFLRAGRYSVQVWFFQAAGPDVLKMEQPFYVLET